MNYFDRLAELDIPYIIIGIVIIILVVKFIFEAFEWVCKKFGIELKNVREKKEQLERLEKSENRINELKTQLDSTTNVLSKIDNSLTEITKDISTIKECVEELKENDLRQNQATIETMHDRITQKSNYYINELKGIPSNELDGYLRMFEAYKGVKGNHGLDRLVNYCVNNLPLLPPNNPAGKEE